MELELELEETTLVEVVMRLEDAEVVDAEPDKIVSMMISQFDRRTTWLS